MKHKLTTTALATLCAITALLATACHHTGGDKPVIAVDMEPQRALVNALMGDSCEVVCLLGENQDPETFELSVNDVKRLSRARVFFFMDAGSTVTHRLINKVPHMVPCEEGISMVEGTHGEQYMGLDPHTWLSVKNNKIIATNMATHLMQVFPARKDDIERRHRALMAHLDSLDSRLARELAPCAGKAFAAWHPALSYFARDYGLRQVALDDGKEMSALHLKEQMERVGRSGATVLLLQRQIDGRQAREINRELGLTIVEFNPMSPRWEEELTHIAHAIATH